MARKIGSIGEQTAQNVRNAALQLFAQKGYAAVSMREIAGQIGLQAGALYNHFPTKQAILVDLLDHHMNELIAAWEAQSHAYNDPLAALIGFVRFHIRFHMDRQDAVFISNMELRNLETDNFVKIEKQRRLYEGFLWKIIQVGVEQNIFNVSDIPVSTRAIIAMLTGLNTWFHSGGRLNVDQIEDIYTKMVLGSLAFKGHDFSAHHQDSQTPQLQAG